MMGEHACHSSYVAVRHNLCRQICAVSSLVPLLHGFWRLNSSCQVFIGNKHLYRLSHLASPCFYFGWFRVQSPGPDAGSTLTQSQQPASGRTSASDAQIWRF